MESLKSRHLILLLSRLGRFLSPHAVRICQHLSAEEVCILSVHVPRVTCLVMSISGLSEDIFTERGGHVRLLSQLLIIRKHRVDLLRY